MAARILLLITDLELGGTPGVVRELAIRLQRTSPNVHVEVACLSVPGPVAVQLEAAGIRVTALNAKGSFDFTVLPRLISLLRQRRLDTVFSFLLHANAVAAAASLWVRDVRFIQSIQTTQPWPAWHWKVQRLVHRAADTIVVPSKSVADCAINWAAIPAEKIAIIPNAIDPGDFSSGQQSPVPNDNPRPYPIVFLGRLDPVKDISTLVAAVARLRPLVHLSIYGEGREHARLAQAIAFQNLAEHVCLRGAVNNPQEALRNAGLLVLPSLAEGFGLVLIEAMASGVPVVATNVAGIRDVVRANETGLLVPPSDAELAADAIKRIVDDKELRQRLITSARSDVQARFTWDLVLAQYRSLLSV